VLGCNLFSGVRDYRFEDGLAAAGPGAGGSSPGSGGSGGAGTGGAGGAAPPWAVRFGGPGPQYINRAEVDFSGAILMVGSLFGSMEVGRDTLMSEDAADVFLVRVDASGTPILARSFGSMGDQFGTVGFLDGSNRLWFAGSFEDDLPLDHDTLQSPGVLNAFFARLQPNGLTDLAIHLNGGGSAFPRGFTLGPTAGYVMAGDFAVDMNSGSGQVTASGEADAFVHLLNTGAKATDWIFDFGDEAYQSFFDVDTTSGRILLAGENRGTIQPGALPAVATHGGADGFVLELDTGGTPQRALGLGDAGQEIVWGVAVDSDGNVYASGNYSAAFSVGDVDFVAPNAEDVFVLKLSPSFVPLWGLSFGGPGNQVARQIMVSESDVVAVAGDFAGSIDIDGTVYDARQGSGGFVALIDSAGNVSDSHALLSPIRTFLSGVHVAADGSLTVAGHFSAELSVFGLTLMGDPDDAEDIFAAHLPAAR
jgi:hypothetical protein